MLTGPRAAVRCICTPCLRQISPVVRLHVVSAAPLATEPFPLAESKIARESTGSGVYCSPLCRFPLFSWQKPLLMQIRSGFCLGEKKVLRVRKRCGKGSAANQENGVQPCVVVSLVSWARACSGSMRRVAAICPRFSSASQGRA